MSIARRVVYAIGFVAVAQSSSTLAARKEAKTEAAVVAAAYDWLAAERRGDVGQLDRRLAPAYRDVTPTGKSFGKADLLKHTATRSDKDGRSSSQVIAAYQAQRSSIWTVVIAGDTAIVTYHPTDPTQRDMVKSFDVFTYDHSMWRGIASSHTAWTSAN